MIEDWFVAAPTVAKAAVPARLKFTVQFIEAYGTKFLPTVEGEQQCFVSAYCDATSGGYAAIHNVESLFCPLRAMLRNTTSPAMSGPNPPSPRMGRLTCRSLYTVHPT